MLSMERVWEDADFYEVEVVAQSELIRASVRSYTTSASIRELGDRLSNFPKTSDDRFFWENGSRGDGSTPFVSLEFQCEDRLGHIIVEVYMELDDGASYDKHHCCFFIRTEAGLLNSFGERLILLNERGIGTRIALSQPED